MARRHRTMVRLSLGLPITVRPGPCRQARSSNSTNVPSALPTVNEPGASSRSDLSRWSRDRAFSVAAPERFPPPPPTTVGVRALQRRHPRRGKTGIGSPVGARLRRPRPPGGLSPAPARHASPPAGRRPVERSASPWPVSAGVSRDPRPRGMAIQSRHRQILKVCAASSADRSRNSTEIDFASCLRTICRSASACSPLTSEVRVVSRALQPLRSKRRAGRNSMPGCVGSQ